MAEPATVQVSTPASLTTTTAGAMSVAVLEPLVQWAFQGFHTAPPEGAAFAGAAVLIVLAHGCQKLFSAWMSGAREMVQAPGAPQLVAGPTPPPAEPEKPHGPVPNPGHLPLDPRPA